MKKDKEFSIRDAQVAVDKWIMQFEEAYFEPMVQIARLVEELGELSRAISHKTGNKIPKKDEKLVSVEEEIGDLFFVLICLANSQNISIENALKLVLEKVENRDKTRWHLKSKD